MNPTHPRLWLLKAIPSALAAGLVLISSPAKANHTSNLAALAADLNNTVSIDDKIFSNFSYVADGLTSFNPANITVTASFENGVYYLTWGGNMSLASPEPASGDLLLTYTVTATGGVITMIDQYYTGSAQGGLLAVDESVYAGNQLVAGSHLEVGDPDDPFAEVGEDLDTSPGYVQLNVIKDIALGVTARDGGFVTISQVRQSFHQRVPEGGSAIALLGMALMGIEGLRRKLGIRFA